MQSITVSIQTGVSQSPSSMANRPCGHRSQIEFNSFPSPVPVSLGRAFCCDIMAGMGKNAKLWLTFAGSMTVYLIWKFVFHFWPLG
jgi:hypothetical protein